MPAYYICHGLDSASFSLRSFSKYLTFCVISPNSPIIDINKSIKKKQIETIQSQYAQTEENLKTPHSPYFKIEKSVDFNIKPSILKKSISPFLTKQQQKYNKSYFFQKIDFWKLGFLTKHPLMNEENNSKVKQFFFSARKIDF